MNKRINNLCFIILTLLACWPAPSARADDAQRQEQQLKAAFIYNFIKFVDWPDEKTVSKKTPITIGIVGSRDFVEAFEPVKHKKVKNRSIRIRYFSGYEKLAGPKAAGGPQWEQALDALKACEVVLFCKRESVPAKHPAQFLRALQAFPVLTIGETSGFLESGGMINFLKQDKKIRFEINHTAVIRGKLRIRSQLMRLAQRVISDKSAK